MADEISEVSKKKLKKNITTFSHISEIVKEENVLLQNTGFNNEFKMKKKKKKRKHDCTNQEIRSDIDKHNYSNLTDVDMVTNNINDTTTIKTEKDNNRKEHLNTVNDYSSKVVAKDDVVNTTSDSATTKKKHKNKRKLVDIDSSNSISIKEEENNDYSKTTIKEEKDDNYSHNTIKKKKKNFITSDEISYTDAKHHNFDLDDKSSVKKKNKKIITEELELSKEECKGRLSVKDIESDHDNEKSKNFKGNQNIIQRPSYFSSDKSTSHDKYLDSKRELKRTWYPDLEEDVVSPNEGRDHTISIALPASILEETCLAHVLRTYVIGQLARAACIYSIDEIVVFNDKCWGNDAANCDKYIGMMKMILEYQECPQYLRKDLFPKHFFLKDVGILNALNAPHHLLAYQWCDYREGVVLSKCTGKFSCVDIGLKSDVQIDRKLELGLRVTVRLPPEAKVMNKLYGYVVSPEEPRTKTGMYWGYTVRVAQSLSEVFKSDRFAGDYDLIIGTSDKGMDASNITFQKFNHALIIFGGVHGLEAAQDADQSLSGSQFTKLFNHYVNVCPNQTSRTIRTEEAVLITLATLCPKLSIKGCTNPR